MVEEGRGDTGRGAEKKIESSIKISKKRGSNMETRNTKNKNKMQHIRKW